MTSTRIYRLEYRDENDPEMHMEMAAHCATCEQRTRYLMLYCDGIGRRIHLLDDNCRLCGNTLHGQFVLRQKDEGDKSIVDRGDGDS